MICLHVSLYFQTMHLIYTFTMWQKFSRFPSAHRKKYNSFLIAFIFFVTWVPVMTMVQLIFPNLYGITFDYIQMFPFPLFGSCLLHSHFNDITYGIFLGSKTFHFLSAYINLFQILRPNMCSTASVTSLLIASKFNNHFLSTFL